MENLAETITLELTRKQAETLMLVACHVGGKASTSRRGHMDTIAARLLMAGVSIDRYDVHTLGGNSPLRVHGPSLFFQDEVGIHR